MYKNTYITAIQYIQLISFHYFLGNLNLIAVLNIFLFRRHVRSKMKFGTFAREWQRFHWTCTHDFYKSLLLRLLSINGKLLQICYLYNISFALNELETRIKTEQKIVHFYTIRVKGCFSYVHDACRNTYLRLSTVRMPLRRSK